MRYLPVFRKLCQAGVLLVFLTLPFLAALDFTAIKGNFFSLDILGVPFADPASTLQVIGQNLDNAGWFLMPVLLGAGASLLLAFFMGRIFCGWICPYGLFSEFAGGRFFKGSLLLKGCIFVGALLLAILLNYPFITWLSMPGQITVAPQILTYDWNLALLVFCVPVFALIVDFSLSGRFFCSSVCPQSLLLGLCASFLPKCLPGLRIRWNRAKCSCKGAPCLKACQFSLNPRKHPERRDCTMCGDCIAVCSKHGAALKFCIKS